MPTFIVFTMGNSNKKMLKPRTLEDLVCTVEVKEDSSFEEAINASPWAQAFYTFLKTKDEGEGSNELGSMFVYLVVCSALAKEEDSLGLEHLLQITREKFFPDVDNGKKINIKFHDPHKKGEDILRLFRQTDWAETSLKELKTKIVSLRQDRNIREKVDDDCFTDFMSHPSCVCHCPWHCPAPPSKDPEAGPSSGNSAPAQTGQTKPNHDQNKPTKYKSIQKQCSQLLSPKTSPPSTLL